MGGKGAVIRKEIEKCDSCDSGKTRDLLSATSITQRLKAKQNDTTDPQIGGGGWGWGWGRDRERQRQRDVDMCVRA